MEYIIDLLFSAAPYVQYISFGLLILAGLNIPVSEDLVFIISASIAATIVPQNTVYIFAGCFLGAYLSDIVAYSIGRFLGPKIFRFSFFKKTFPEQKIQKIEDYFEKFGKKTLFIGRFIPFGVRNVLFFTAGLIKLAVPKFLIVDLLALVCTSTILFTIGFTVGINYKNIFPYLDLYKFSLFIIFILFIVFIILKKKKGEPKNEIAV